MATLSGESLADPAGDCFGVADGGSDAWGRGADRIQGGEEVAGFPDMRARPVGTNAAGIAPRMNREQLIGHPGGEVHRAAVYTDDKNRMAKHPEEFGETGFVEQVGDVGREVGEFFFAASDEDDGAIDGSAESSDRIRGERLVLAAGKRMEQHEWLRGELLGGAVAVWKIEDWRSRKCGADRGGEGEVAFDRVGLVINRSGVSLGEACTLACIGKSVNRHATKDAGNECGAQKPLEIEDEIRCGLFFQSLTPAVETEPSGGSAKVGAGKNQRFIDVRVALQQRGPFRVDHPCDVRGGKFRAKGGYSGQGMDDVPEGTRFEDKNAGGIHLPTARRSANSAGRPASMILRCVVSMS